MRNLDERMAEISRRSGEIIRRRKRRRGHILMVCIPLVLCIGLYAAPTVMFPETTDQSNGAAATEPAGSVASAYVAADILGAGAERHITDAAEVNNIYHVIRSSCMADNIYGFAPESAGGESNGDGGQDDEMEDYVIGATGTGSSCTVIFSTAEGAETAYTLSGNELVNESTGEKFVLTEKQLQDIKKALGLH